MDFIDDKSLGPVEAESLGEHADALLMANPRLALNLLVMLARRVTGPFGGFISIPATEQRASNGYNLRFYVKNPDKDDMQYNIEVRTPLGVRPDQLLRTRG